MQVKLAGGEQTLCMLPAKFNKKLWVKRGGYLVIEHGCVDAGESVTGTIVSVLYDADVRHLKSLPGVWCALLLVKALIPLQRTHHHRQVDAMNAQHNFPTVSSVVVILAWHDHSTNEVELSGIIYQGLPCLMVADVPFIAEVQHALLLGP